MAAVCHPRLKALIDESDALFKVPPASRTEDQKARLKALPGEIKAVRAEIDQEAELQTLVNGERERASTPVTQHVHPGTGDDAPADQDGGSSRKVRLKAMNDGSIEFDGFVESEPTPLTIGEALVASPQYREARDNGLFGRLSRGQGVSFNLSGPKVKPALKALMMTSNGFAPPVTRIGVVTELPIRPTQLQAFLPSESTSAALIEFMQQTTRINAAAPVMEGALKPEGARVWSPKQLSPQVIAEYQPVTRQQLADVPQIRAVVDNQLIQEDLVKEEDLLLYGSGTAPEMEGIMTRPGRLTQSAAGLTLAEAIAKAVKKMRIEARLQPSAFLIHPDDMETIEMEKDDMGQYRLGHPLLNVAKQWKWTPIVTDAIQPRSAGATGGPVVLDTSRMVRYIREEVNVTVGWINDQFIRNELTILAELRSCLAIYREDAICQVVA